MRCELITLARLSHLSTLITLATVTNLGYIDLRVILVPEKRTGVMLLGNPDY